MHPEENEGLAELYPINFFQIVGECPYAKGHELPTVGSAPSKQHLLPSTAALCYEKPFAQIAVGWNEEGLLAAAAVAQPIQEISYPDVTRGDSIELFIDTRDIKSSGFNTRFCHHFYFLPQSIDGHQAGEVTHFRTDDSHPLCDPGSLHVSCKKGKESYQLYIFIPSQSLYGYDPEQFTRIGFSYRINRPDGPQQHFSAVTQEYKLEQQPALWSSLQLVK